MQNYIILKIIMHQDDDELGELGTCYIKTNNLVVINEIIKYKCTFRLSAALDYFLNYDNVYELIQKPLDEDIDIVHDISTNIDKFTDHLIEKNLSLDAEKYVQQTLKLGIYGK